MEVSKVTTDVVVIGGGGAGCRAAVEVAERGLDCILVDKGRPGRSGATPCALWSIQAPFGPRGRDERDTPEEFLMDMVVGGRFLGDQNLTEIVAFTACDRVLDLERYGVHFKKYDDGRFYQTPMPGQTYPRSCFMYENGQHMSTVLAKEVARHENIKVYKDFMVFDFLKNEGKVVGIVGIDQLSGEVVAINAKATIAATGGYTSLWGFSDNPPTLTGDAISMAYRAGADIVDLEFNQYYGTDVIWPPSVKGVVVLYELLIDEFASGDVTDRYGKPLFQKPLPIRDEAIKIIFKAIQEGRGTEHNAVLFDTTRSPKGEEEVRRIFKEMTPKHYQLLIDAAGLDLAKTPLEVAPASHYQCGGIFINERAQSTIPGLYACGECCGNWQGANRIAGTALCGTQTIGKLAGEYASNDVRKETRVVSIDEKDLDNKVKYIESFMSKKKDPIRPVFIKEKILETMDKYVAPFRNEKSMKEGLSIILSLRDELLKIEVSSIKRCNMELREAIESRLMIEAADLTLRSALFRTESRGHHNRTDYPEQDDVNWLKHTVIKDRNGKPEFSKRDVIHSRINPPVGKKA